jgi:hypothetical protein
MAQYVASHSDRPPILLQKYGLCVFFMIGVIFSFESKLTTNVAKHITVMYILA